MPKIFSPDLEVRIKVLSEEKYTYRQIKEKIKKEGHDVSLSTISRVLKNIGIRRQVVSRGQPVPRFRRFRKKTSPGVIQKIKNMVTKRNPMSYRDIAAKTSLNLATIHSVIHRDLQLNTRKKTKTHELDEKQKKNRKTNCRKLYENHLAANRCEYAVTLDEALIYLQDSSSETKFCYVKKGEKVPDDWVLEKDESFKQGFMVIGIITGRGTLPLFRVPSEVKINADYYVEYVLKPLFTIYLPSLYPGEMDKVFFHHGKATSHTANKTTQYLEEVKRELGISYLNKEDIPVKCPDGSPLDFFGFGYLKTNLGKRRGKTLDGIWKLSKKVWSEIDLKMIQKVFASWKRRLRLISRSNGEHIEQLKQIHTRFKK